MNNFKRENRYVVFKRKNLSHAQGKVLHSIESELCPDGNVKECLVVEHDWPCYDAAWNMIVKLSAGKFSDPYAEIKQLRERVKELERDAKNNELVHVGFTNGDQITYAKTEEGSFYPVTSGSCYIPLYMLKSHEHRVETTSLEQLRKEQASD